MTSDTASRLTELTTDSKTSFLASLEKLTAQGRTLGHVSFELAIEQLSEGEFSTTEWVTVVDFTADQLGRWQVEWLFSNAAAPNAVALAEVDGWTVVWKGFSKVVIDLAPELGEPLGRKRDLVAIQHALARTLTRGGVWGGIGPALSRLAILADRVGFPGLGRWMYGLALYPPGSVGRAQ